MTVYVDDAGIRATVHDTGNGRHYNARWSHLFCDGDLDELHAFAARIGMQTPRQLSAMEARAWMKRNAATVTRSTRWSFSRRIEPAGKADPTHAESAQTSPAACTTEPIERSSLPPRLPGNEPLGTPCWPITVGTHRIAPAAMRGCWSSWPLTILTEEGMPIAEVLALIASASSDGSFVPDSPLAIEFSVTTATRLSACTDTVLIGDSRWFQDWPEHRYPHYDLVAARRERAIKAGAVPVTWREAPTILREAFPAAQWRALKEAS